MTNSAQLAHPGDVLREEKRLRALQLREQGAKYRDIAQAMDVNLSDAHTLVQEGLAALHLKVEETAIEVRALELNRLDGLTYALLMKIRRQVRSETMKTGAAIEVPDPDPRTVDTLLKVMERRAKLLGLDAPVKLAGPDGGPIPFSLEDGREVLEAKLGAMFKRLAAATATVVETGAIDDAALPSDGNGVHGP